MNPAGRRRPAERGFTLIELMLSVLILAIIMAVAYGVVVSTMQAQERVEEILTATEIGPAIISQIREDLESALIPKSNAEYFVGIDRKHSSGNRDRLDFVTGRMAYGAEREGDDPYFHSVNEAGYQVQDNKEDGTVGVLYRREDLWVDAEPLRGGRLVELYDRVKEFNVRYWQNDKWIDTWSSKNDGGKLPRAVLVELRLLVTDRQDQILERLYTTIVTYPR